MAVYESILLRTCWLETAILGGRSKFKMLHQPRYIHFQIWIGLYSEFPALKALTHTIWTSNNLGTLQVHVESTYFCCTSHQCRANFQDIKNRIQLTSALHIFSTWISKPEKCSDVQIVISALATSALLVFVHRVNLQRSSDILKVKSPQDPTL